MLDRRGFTLLEILVVTVIMGLVVTASYSVFLNTQRTAYTSEEVVEVQQNLRVALDWMSRDFRMAGFLVDGAAITAAPPYLMRDLNNDGDFADANETLSLTLNTSASNGIIARIDADASAPADPLTLLPVTVSSADMVDLFVSGNDANGDYVRIIRPAIVGEPLDRVFRVTNRDRTVPNLTLREFNSAVQLKRGDLIIRVGRPTNDPDSDPNTNPPNATTTITYRLLDDPDSADPTLKRLVRNAGDVVANKITAVDLFYFTDDGIPIANTAGREDEIRTVQIKKYGATDANLTGKQAFSGVKTRQIETYVKLRNF